MFAWFVHLSVCLFVRMFVRRYLAMIYQIRSAPIVRKKAEETG